MRRAFPLLALAFAAILAVGVNLLAARLLPQARIDLTAQRLYTLAPGTRQVLAGLTEPVTLRLFSSRRLGAELPQYGAYAERVRDLLREYVTSSRGRLRLELLDPEPFSEAEDRAVARGLQGVPLDQGGEQVFFGKGQCATCHPAPSFLDHQMHDLHLERFLDEPGDGPIKSFTLRGIKDSPPYLHDGRCLTLEDPVEFFNLVLELKLTKEEKADLVAFLRAL
jgi:hypothetical protein